MRKMLCLKLNVENTEKAELKLIPTFVTLKLNGPIGRYRLKEMLSLSEQEGIVRLMRSDLK